MGSAVHRATQRERRNPRRPATDRLPPVYGNIVVAYDGSEGAKAALAKAVEIAAAEGAALTVVEATAEQTPALVPGAPRHTPPEEGGAGAPGAAPGDRGA